MLKKEMPDLIGLQECQTPASNFVMAIPDYAMYKMPYDASKPKQTQGPIILYNTKTVKLADSGMFWLGETPDEPCLPWDSEDRHYRMCTWVKAITVEGNKPVFFFNTHLPYKKADHPQRLKCAELIVSRMKKTAGQGAVCFLVGDLNQAHFNADGTVNQNAYCLQPFFNWMKEGRETAPKTDNYGSHSAKADDAPRTTPDYDLDHIFYRNCTATEFRTVIETYGVQYLSDHYPITLTVTAEYVK